MAWTQPALARAKPGEKFRFLLHRVGLEVEINVHSAGRLLSFDVFLVHTSCDT